MVPAPNNAHSGMSVRTFQLCVCVCVCVCVSVFVQTTLRY